MENNQGKTVNLWNAFKSIFATEEDNKEFEKELAEIQKVEEQVRAEKEKFGASLRVNKISGGKAKKGKGIQTQQKAQQKEQEREIGE